MPGFRLFFKCVAEAVVSDGLRGLAGLVPFGPCLYEISAKAYNRYQKQCQEEKMRDAVLAVAQANLTEVKAEAKAVFQEIRDGADTSVKQKLVEPGVEEAITNYLVQIPGSVRQSLRRPSDPSGKSVPADFALRNAEDMFKLLPARPVRFHAGEQPVGNWVLKELLGTGGYGERASISQGDPAGRPQVLPRSRGGPYFETRGELAQPGDGTEPAA